ncbi:MAG: YbaK/EbsC family protein [Thermofilaceae archaeon]
MLGPGDLNAFLKGRRVKYELVKVLKAATSIEAARSLGVDLSFIAKTVVMLTDTGYPILVVIRADKRVNLGELARLLGLNKLRLATGSEVAEITGYAPGGVPPLAHARKLPVYLDKELLELEYVYTGGGDDKHLLRISPADIVKMAEATVVNIPKK